MPLVSWAPLIRGLGMEIVGEPSPDEAALVEHMIAGYALDQHSPSLAQTCREICIASNLRTGEDWFFFAGVSLGAIWEKELQRRFEATLDLLWDDRTVPPPFQERFQCILGGC